MRIFGSRIVARINEGRNLALLQVENYRSLELCWRRYWSAHILAENLLQSPLEAVLLPGVVGILLCHIRTAIKKSLY